MLNILNPAVIINEFGKRSVDGQLIERPEVPMSEITEGFKYSSCSCCDTSDFIAQQMHPSVISLIGTSGRSISS
jgi:G3E family GTPase